MLASVVDTFDETFTVAAGALGNATIHGHSSILQTLQVLLCRAGPSSLLSGATRLITQMKADLVGLLKLALKIDKRLGLGQLLLLVLYCISD